MAIPDLTFAPHLPGLFQRIESTLCAINLLKIIREAHRGRWTETVRESASRCLNHELAILARYSTNRVEA